LEPVVGEVFDRVPEFPVDGVFRFVFSVEFVEVGVAVGGVDAGSDVAVVCC
jgi:hypothetical protein